MTMWSLRQRKNRLTVIADSEVKDRDPQGDNVLLI